MEYNSIDYPELLLRKEAFEDEQKRKIELWQELLKPIYILLRQIVVTLRNVYKRKGSQEVRETDIIKFWFDKQDVSKAQPLSRSELAADKERLKNKAGVKRNNKD